MFFQKLITKIKKFLGFKSDFSVLYESLLPNGSKIRIVQFNEDENKDGIIFVYFFVQVKYILNWHDVLKTNTIKEAMDEIDYLNEVLTKEYAKETH